MVRQAAGKLEYSFGGCIIGDEFRSAFPADFDTREQIGLGSGKTVETSRFELQLTKNLDVRGKGYQGAAPVGRSADLFQRAQGMASGQMLPIELIATRHFNALIAGARVIDTNDKTDQPPRR